MQLENGTASHRQNVLTLAVALTLALSLTVTVSALTINRIPTPPNHYTNSNLTHIFTQKPYAVNQTMTLIFLYLTSSHDCSHYVKHHIVYLISDTSYVSHHEHPPAVLVMPALMI